MKKNVYIPIEVAKREVLPKCYIACELASKGMDVYLFEDYIFDKYGYPGAGVYLGKNIFKTEVPYSLKYFNSMKRQGVNLFYLDEEGGIYGGKDISEWTKTLLGRVDPKSFDLNDYYLSWGVWQASVFKERSKANVIVTGSPNYEICKPKYKDTLLDVEITKSKKNYILVNTRFGYANSKDGISNVIGKSSPSSKNFSYDHYLRFLAADMQYVGHFINLIIELSIKFNNTEIIIRPHPAEDSNFYRSIFATHNNITVNGDGHISTWLREAACIIHNGCSTAIQAIIAGKPVITYLPTVTDGAELALTNSVGWKASTVDRVVELVDCALRGELGQSEDYNFESTISSNNPFEEISRILSDIDLFPIKEESNKMKKISISVFLKNVMKIFLKRKSSFDVAEFNRIPLYIKAASRYYGCVVSIDRPCYGVYRIRAKYVK